MLGDLITIGLLVYVIGFYIWKYRKLNELKTQYPAFLSDGKGIEHYYIRSWHYVKNKKTVALYESPNQTLRAKVDDGTYVKKGETVMEISGCLRPDKQSQKTITIAIKTYTSGYFYRTPNDFTPLKPIFDGAEIFTIETNRRETQDEIKIKHIQEQENKWPDEEVSEPGKLILSPKLFSKKDKKRLNLSYNTYFLKLDNSIQEFDYVQKGQFIGSIESQSCLYKDYEIEAKVYANQDGYIAKNHHPVAVNGIIASFFETQNEAIESVHPLRQAIVVKEDEFSSETIVSSLRSVTLQNKLNCYFVCINNFASLKLTYEHKELAITKGDSFDFLFADSKLHFNIVKSPIRGSKDSKQRVCYISLNQSELNTFVNEPLKAIRINLKEQDKVTLQNNTLSRPSVVCEYHMQQTASLFKNELEKLAIQIQETEENERDNKETSCYVYIMKDESNGSHKIGISNKPEYREKTLQSDKPYITLLQAKEFPSRTIARAFESALHKTYESKHLRGEWFDLSEDEVNEVIQALK